MSALPEVTVGQVYAHPLDGTRWEVRITNPGQTKLESRDDISLMWVDTGALLSTWRPVTLTVEQE